MLLMKQPRLGVYWPYRRVVGFQLGLAIAFDMFHTLQRSSARRFRHALFRTGLRIFSPTGISAFISGVDGISIAMILLDGVGGGGPAYWFSWEVDKMARILLPPYIIKSWCLWFFISIDLMILFLLPGNWPVIPKYLLIAVGAVEKRNTAPNWP